MANTTTKYPSLANVTHDLTLFFKLNQGSQLSLADFTKIAEGRWEYFRDNWDFLKTGYSNRISQLPNSQLKTNAQQQYIDFGDLVLSNRASSQNPLSNAATVRKFHDLLDLIY